MLEAFHGEGHGDVAVAGDHDHFAGIDLAAEADQLERERGLGRSRRRGGLVGDGIRTAGDVVARIFSTSRKAGVTARMISMGATRINVSFLVADEDVEKAVQALHKEFF